MLPSSPASVTCSHTPDYGEGGGDPVVRKMGIPSHMWSVCGYTPLPAVSQPSEQEITSQRAGSPFWSSALYTFQTETSNTPPVQNRPQTLARGKRSVWVPGRCDPPPNPRKGVLGCKQPSPRKQGLYLSSRENFSWDVWVPACTTRADHQHDGKAPEHPPSASRLQARAHGLLFLRHPLSKALSHFYRHPTHHPSLLPDTSSSFHFQLSGHLGDAFPFFPGGLIS